LRWAAPERWPPTASSRHRQETDREVGRMQARVLVVDDEPALVEVVTYNLRLAGFETVVAEDGHEALRQAETAKPDLVLLDLMLPGLDGLTVCRALRSRYPDLPVIILTARGDEPDRVLGLELGADDYISKPFSPRELVARVRAVLRRSRRPAGEGAAGEGAAWVPGPVRLGPGLELDPRAREVRRDGRVVPLTPTEFRLLETLLGHAGETLSRTRLFELVWGPEAYGDERTVDVHIRHLREKLEDDPSDPRLIVTVRGFGYRLRPGAGEAGDGGGAGR